MQVSLILRLEYEILNPNLLNSCPNSFVNELCSWRFEKYSKALLQVTERDLSQSVLEDFSRTLVPNCNSC